MCSGMGDTTQLVPGFPIRTPWDHSSVDSSPRPIAASHVLHRLLMPRHPPCALDNLTNTPTPATQSSSKPKTAHTRGHARPKQVKKKDARIHSALDNHTRRPPPPTRTRESSNDCPEKTPTPTKGGRSSPQDPTVRRRLRVLSSTYSKKQPHPHPKKHDSRRSRI